MARGHSHGGVVCEHATKKSCDLARKAALGQCTSMIDSKSEPYPCPNWSVDKVNERGHCGQHIASVLARAIEAERVAAKRAKIDASIDRYLAWTKDHHSVWDKMPDGWAPEARGV